MTFTKRNLEVLRAVRDLGNAYRDPARPMRMGGAFDRMVERLEREGFIDTNFKRRNEGGPLQLLTPLGERMLASYDGEKSP